MALFFHYNEEYSNGARKTGFARYREILERDFSHFLIINLITLISFLPLFIGATYALLSSSLLLMIPACTLGGALAGPFLCGLLDTIFRSMRDSTSHFMKAYFKSLKKNAMDSIFTGAVVFCFLGLYAFLIMIWLTVGFPGILHITLALLSIIIFVAISTLYFLQIVLFQQTIQQRLLNCLLFIIKYFKKVMGVTILQLMYWVCFILFLPYTLLLLPLLGIWFIGFLTLFLLYNSINEAFSLEDKIAQAFPEQAVFYETDEEWVNRKRE